MLFGIIRASLFALLLLSPASLLAQAVKVDRNSTNYFALYESLDIFEEHARKLPLRPCKQDLEVYRYNKDNFFPARLYSQLAKTELGGSRDRYHFDGRLADCSFSGRTLTIEQMGVVAAAIMERRAAELGIAKQNITRAMFAGKFNPDFRDVLLAFYGGSPTKFQEAWRSSEFWGRSIAEGGRAFNANAFGRRCEVWNQRYGFLRSALDDQQFDFGGFGPPGREQSLSDLLFGEHSWNIDRKRTQSEDWVCAMRVFTEIKYIESHMGFKDFYKGSLYEYLRLGGDYYESQVAE